MIDHLIRQRMCFILNQCGQSLVQVLVSVALIGVLIMTIAGMTSYQARELSALSQKLASTDLERVLQTSLSDGSVCSYILAAAQCPTCTFNSDNVSPTTPQLLTPGLPLYASVKTTPALSFGPAIATVGQPASSYSSSAIIRSIALSISGASSPAPPPGPGAVFTGNWLITLDPAKLVRPLRPISIATTITADTTNPAAATVTGCQTSGGGGGAGTSLVGNGYATLPGGLIIQWGTTPPLAWATTTTVPFPIAFPNACFTVTLTPASVGGAAPQAQDFVSNITTTNFTWGQNQYGSVAARWIAIGW